jgi:predicted ATPase
VKSDLPTGTVTFLFTDVEGSTRLLRELGAEAYADALAEHRRIVREACAAGGGVEVDTQGDAFFFAFPSAPGAIVAAQEITEALAEGDIRLRIGLHTGTPLVTAEGYVGDDVHFAARVAASGYGGQVLLSKSSRELVHGLSVTDLGEHRLKDIAEPVSIYQLGGGTFPPLKTISNTNLPRPANSFVGREREQVEVVRELRSGTRLLTLTGSGGSGKTRLALEAAAELVPSYKAGVFWIGLAALREPSLVVETIAQTLGAREGLAEHIGEREILLLLDNLEQVIEAAAELSGLIATCPNLALLVTSRELLRVQGEVEYPVPPLASADAVELFCDRSRLDASDEIAELCSRLDDLPLALELAAARTKALSPTQILGRLSERLDLLKGGRDAETRQQTLRATIAWSYDLLSQDERRLVRALSIFAGGCTLGAAEDVANADLDTLQSLVEKSLLRFTPERYWMLETIREYARNQLDAAGETEALTLRHARHYLGLIEERQPLILGPRRGDLLAWFGAEEDNLRAALDRLEDADLPAAARAADLLSYFWIPRGQLVEGRERFQALLAHDVLSNLTRARLLERLSDHEQRLGEFELGEAHAREAVALADEAGDRRIVAQALRHVGFIAAYRGDLDDATRVFMQVLEEAGDDQWLKALALGDLAPLEIDARRDEEARKKLREACEGFRATGDEANEAVATINLAFLELFNHDFEAARRAALSVVEKNRMIGDHYRGIGGLNTLGFAAVGLGRRTDAREAFAESFDLVLAAGMTGHEVLTETLSGIALATEPKAFGLAARLLGAVARLDEDASFSRSSRQLELQEFLALPLIEALGREMYGEEQRFGGTLMLDETIDLARLLVEPSAATPDEQRTPR